MQRIFFIWLDIKPHIKALLRWKFLRRPSGMWKPRQALLPRHTFSLFAEVYLCVFLCSCHIGDCICVEPCDISISAWLFEYIIYYIEKVRSFFPCECAYKPLPQLRRDTHIYIYTRTCLVESQYLFNSSTLTLLSSCTVIYIVWW